MGRTTLEETEEQRYISVEGVEFHCELDKQYRCKVCAFAVPLPLLRAHARRHPLDSAKSQNPVERSQNECEDSQQVRKRPAKLSVGCCLRKVRKASVYCARLQALLERSSYLAYHHSFRRWYQFSFNEE